MKRMKSLLVGAAVTAALAFATTAANAATYIVSGTFDDGQTFSGKFTLNVDGYLQSANITTNPGPVLPGFTYSWIHGGPSNSYAANGSDYLSLQPGYEGDLNLQFLNPLGAGKDPIVGGEGGPSYECANSFSCYVPSGGDIRYVANGFAEIAVPEPATWALMLFGIGGLGATLRVGRRRNAALTATA